MLTGGQRRRRVAPRLIAVALLVVAIAAGGTAYYLGVRDKGGSGGGSELPLAATPVHSGAPGDSPLLRRPPTPRVSMGGSELRFAKPPHAALLFDVDSGRVLGSYKPYQRLPIASLTKIMTALLATEAAGPNERVMITKAVLNYREAGLGVLPRGKRVRFEALLDGLLLRSGNDAANGLAVHVSGNVRRFVAQMNRQAHRLGLHCTHYVSPHGLEPANVSCARDLAVLTRLAMRNTRISRTARKKGVTLRFPIKGGKLVIPGHNPLIRDLHYPGAIGLKTGFINESGRCFVGVARRRGRTFGVVLLNSPNPGKQAAGLLDMAFRQAS